VAGYEYKPKGIDIRIARTKKKKKPTEEPCDWEGCVSMGGCKAPKGPDRLREYYNFCTAHAREYNKNWNFFSGMTDSDIATATAQHGMCVRTQASAPPRRKSARQGLRRPRRKAIIFSAKAILLTKPNPRAAAAFQPCSLDLGLDDTATKDVVRKRYTQLVKQLHPDANQGDRTTEESFQRVVKAHKILKSTGLA